MSHLKSTTKMASIRQRFALNISNVQVSPHENGGWFISLPGFKYDDFNRAGVLDLFKIDRLSQTILFHRTLSEIWKTCFKEELDQQEMMPNLPVYLVGRQWTFSPRLYQRAAIDFPMKMRWTVVAVGKSSFDQQQTFFEDDTNSLDDKDNNQSCNVVPFPSGVCQQPLASSVYRLVHVDSASRRPAPLPSNIAHRLSQIVADDGSSFSTHLRPTIRVPDTRTFTCCVTVRFDDVDFQGHTNTSSYTAFALECASQAAAVEFYSEIRGDVAIYRVSRSNSLHLGECHAGDELDVSTWEDEGNRLLLNFAIKKREQIIFVNQIEFFDDSIFE